MSWSKDRVTIVTGSSRGIGKATALGYAKEGAKLETPSKTTKCPKNAGRFWNM
ncbi:MAG: hypothetical protein ACE5KI_03740 [Dehalococcoidia bacterium]